MFDLDIADLYIPNTEAMRDLLKSLNYRITPISYRTRRDPVEYKSICFEEWIVLFDCVKQADEMYYALNEATLTEEQSIFAMNILHVCPDYATFKEALEQHVNSNP